MKWILYFFFLWPVGEALAWQTGDVLLQELNCYSCAMIAAEGNSVFSHVGLVVVEEGGPHVYQAFGQRVHRVTLEKFFAQGPGLRVKLMRPRFLDGQSQKKLSVVARSTLGLAYDSQFLWDNVDQFGRELFYCSEFVGKVLNKAMGRAIIPPTPMSFQKFYQQWLKILHGKVPEGLPGLHPAVFEHHAEFRAISL